MVEMISNAKNFNILSMLKIKISTSNSIKMSLIEVKSILDQDSSF